MLLKTTNNTNLEGGRNNGLLGISHSCLADMDLFPRHNDYYCGSSKQWHEWYNRFKLNSMYSGKKVAEGVFPKMGHKSFKRLQARSR